MGDGRAEGSLAIGDGGQATIALMPDPDGTHVHVSERSRLVGDLLLECIHSLLCEENVLQNTR